jgi:TetR/AcrR family transcriptional regulator, cholesterol catabolism regulator
MSELSRKRQRAGQTPSRNYITRRRALIRAAAEVFRIKGLSGTSLHDISEAIGVDRASLYYYFGSKEQLA